MFDDAQALKIAEVLLYASWLERNVYEFNLGLRNIAVEPTDVLTLSVDGVEHSVRVQEIDVGRPGIIECKAVAQDASNYISFAVGQSGEEPTEDNITFIYATDLIILDIPLLRREDEVNSPDCTWQQVQGIQDSIIAGLVHI